VGRMTSNIGQIFISLYAYVVNHVKHTSLAIIISIFALVGSIIFAREQDKSTKAQIELLKKQINLSVPPTVQCFYDKESESISIRNTGLHDIKNVTISFLPFFVFEDGRTYTMQGIHKLIKEDKKLQEKIKKSTTLNLEKDIYDVFPGKEYLNVNEDRKETYSYIKSGLNGDSTECVGKLSIETFHPSNFLFLSKALGCKLIIRGNIYYELSETSQAFTLVQFYIIETNVRENIEDIIGGQHIKHQIETLLDTTTGEIFR
jgi:hypothetical protein